jgi:hypothetical protein
MQSTKYIEHLIKSISYSQTVTSATRHTFERNLRSRFERLFSLNPYPGRFDLRMSLENVLYGMSLEEVVYFRYDALDPPREE